MPNPTPIHRRYPDYRVIYAVPLIDYLTRLRGLRGLYHLKTHYQLLALLAECERLSALARAGETEVS